ncbi:hypothetical protein AMECASPLE_029877 [Ameca splendens]|uniref:Uncharacterized protein n=1 Tax=Ameca splendens TaxID=208324 RepID=A0ABV0XUR9_9TELE
MVEDRQVGEARDAIGIQIAVTRRAARGPVEIKGEGRFPPNRYQEQGNCPLEHRLWTSKVGSGFTREQNNLASTSGNQRFFKLLQSCSFDELQLWSLHLLVTLWKDRRSRNTTCTQFCGYDIWKLRL